VRVCTFVPSAKAMDADAEVDQILASGIREPPDALITMRFCVGVLVIVRRADVALGVTSAIFNTVSSV